MFSIFAVRICFNMYIVLYSVFLSLFRSKLCISPWGICAVTSRDYLVTWIEKSSGEIGTGEVNIWTFLKKNKVTFFLWQEHKRTFLRFNFRIGFDKLTFLFNFFLFTSPTRTRDFIKKYIKLIKDWFKFLAYNFLLYIDMEHKAT